MWTTGQIVEIATVGNEGFVGLPAFLGSDSSTVRMLCQIPGECLRMKAAEFKAAIKNGGALHRLLNLYTQALINQISQTAFCNRAHAIEQRMARWLLMTHDRVEGDEFPLTQEFLGQMLGVRRQQVSQVASALQNKGLIRYVRGVMSIVDRRGLEVVACDCYRIVRQQYDQLTG